MMARAAAPTTPRWAVLTVWVVVNAVNLLQTVGFLTRPAAPEVNRLAGIVMTMLAIPATAALVAFVRDRSGWRFIVGPLVYDGFIAFSLVVDYWLDVEFRSPRRPEILVPYLALFFGAIFLMGVPMFRIDRRLWAVTALTTVALIASMVWALSVGVG
jgi:hypothetical protein